MIARWRSLLFLAADDQARLAKIAERGAGAVILDLEDAVPAERKSAARAGLADALGQLTVQGLDTVVRINAGWCDALEDLAVAARAGASAIMVPKVEDAGRLAVIGEIAADHARVAGLPKAPDLIALVESPAGLGMADRLTAVDRVVALALGSEDFALALGVPPVAEALDLPCRMLALAAAGRGIMALGLPISIATIDDMGAWAAAIARARAIGMTGALCIHPRQVALVNRAFQFSAADYAAAREILAAWEKAPGAGAIMVNGRMVDLPVVLAAQHVVAEASSRDGCAE